MKNQELPGPVATLGQLLIHRGLQVRVHVVIIMEQELEHAGGAAGGRDKFGEAALAGSRSLAVQVLIIISRGDTVNAVRYGSGAAEAAVAPRPGKKAELLAHLFRGEPVGLDLPDILVAQRNFTHGGGFTLYTLSFRLLKKYPELDNGIAWRGIGLALELFCLGFQA